MNCFLNFILTVIKIICIPEEDEVSETAVIFCQNYMKLPFVVKPSTLIIWGSAYLRFPYMATVTQHRMNCFVLRNSVHSMFSKIIISRLGPVTLVNHTSWVAVVTPTDRPKSVRNRCLIELFCGVVCVFTLPFWQFRGCRGFCHRTESDLLLFVFQGVKTSFGNVNNRRMIWILMFPF